MIDNYVMETLACGAFDNSRYGFVADNTLASLPIVDLGAGSKVLSTLAGLRFKFSPGDNFVIKQAMIAVPHGFTVGAKLPYLTVTNSGNGFGILGGSGDGIIIPALNQWFDLDVPIDFRRDMSGGAVAISLTLANLVGEISQAGMPAVLNGATVRVTPVFRILHNGPLTT